MSSRRDDESWHESIEHGMAFIGLCHFVAEWRSILWTIVILIGLIIAIVFGSMAADVGGQLRDPKFLFLFVLPLAGIIALAIKVAPPIRRKWYAVIDSKAGARVVRLWRWVPSELRDLAAWCAIFLGTLAAIIGVLSALLLLYSSV